MMSPPSRTSGRLTFDPQALYDAIDAQGRERGMTWSERGAAAGFTN